MLVSTAPSSWGQAQEADGESYQQNETLLSRDPGHPGSPPTIMEPTTCTLTTTWAGDWGIHPIPAGVVINSMGTGAPGKWCGGMRTISIPQDSEGEAGAKNFWCYLNWWFQTAYMGADW